MYWERVYLGEATPLTGEFMVISNGTNIDRNGNMMQEYRYASECEKMRQLIRIFKSLRDFLLSEIKFRNF